MTRSCNTNLQTLTREDLCTRAQKLVRPPFPVELAIIAQSTMNLMVKPKPFSASGVIVDQSDCLNGSVISKIRCDSRVVVDADCAKSGVRDRK